MNVTRLDRDTHETQWTPRTFCSRFSPYISIHSSIPLFVCSCWGPVVLVFKKSLTESFLCPTLINILYVIEIDDDPVRRAKTPTTSEKRTIVTPNPFDQATPKRTRTASGSVVRIFRGQFIGRLGGSIRSQGDDARIVIKEFTGTLAQSLARQEQTTLGILQSQLLEAQIVRNTNTKTKKKDDDPTDTSAWIQAAGARSVLGRTDDKHVTQLLQALSTKAPYLGTNYYIMSTIHSFPYKF